MTTDDVTHLRALLAEQTARAEKAEAERDIAYRKLDSLGHTLLKYEETQAMLTNTIKHVERERDHALAACAEMRAALERSTNAHQAALYDEDLDRDDERDAQRVIDDTHALLSRPDLGAGKVLVERERLTAWRDLLTELAPTCRCDEAWTSRGRHEVNALCHMADEAKAAIADLDALLNKKVGG